jgi:hypothetical protein
VTLLDEHDAPAPQIQVPEVLWVPDRLGSFGPQAIDFGQKIGIPTDIVQKRDIDCLLSYGKNGRWTALETAIIEGRQNGKTKSVILTCALFDAFLLGTNLDDDRIVWTAQRMTTTLDTFTLIQKKIQTYGILSRRVKKINDSQEEHSIEMMDGTIFSFIARSDAQGRGLSGRRLILDEALFLKSTFMGALLPTLSSRDNPQIMYGSSAGKGESDHLRALEARGRRGNDPSLILIEYKAPGGWDDPGCERGIQCTHFYEHESAPNCAMDNENNWRRANHAIGVGRMRTSFVRAERRSLCQPEAPEGVIEFGRERMGWTELGGESLDPERIPAADWKVTEDPASEPVGPVCFSVDMSPDGSAGAIGVAGLRADGDLHTGVVFYTRNPAVELPQRLSKLQEKHESLIGALWCVDAPVKALMERFRASGCNMEPVTQDEYSRDCGSMKAHVVNHTVRHRPSVILDSAFTSVERRVLPEGAFVFGRRKSSGDISPFVAATLAVGGMDRHGEHEPAVWEL